jgi:Protein of unknown function (DUF1269)
MANKDRNVVLAYFPSADKADMAANSLKEWDQANDDIKLGGIAILTASDGKVDIRKVTPRSTGAGAKAGTIVGVVAAVLSGGVTLVGGVLVGVAGGALLGSFRKKGVKLTDADQQKMVAELNTGKAAVVVMVDDNEVEPTQKQLMSYGMGVQVDNFEVPAEAMAEVEKAAEKAG